MHARRVATLLFAISVLAITGCGYQGDPEAFADANAKEFREATADLAEVAKSLRAITQDLRAASDEMQATAQMQAARDLQRAADSLEDLVGRIGTDGVAVAPAGTARPRATLRGDPNPGTVAAAPTATDAAEYELPLVRYEWDPAAGDPAVPAELGGPGFTGEGWLTNMEFPALGQLDAPKGGRMVMPLTDWPATLRQTGKDWNQSFNYTANDLCMGRLILQHPITLDFIPQLATHWWVSPDKMTYRFRINPRARWSDGKEVTADDVVASWKLRVDPDTLDPSSLLSFNKFEQPVAKSKYLLEVRCVEENWRNLLYFGEMSIMPAASISDGGSAYLDRFQFAYPPSAGPYIVKPEDIVTGESVTLTRRTDWWDANNPAWRGLYNIDEFKFVVVLDMNLTFEKLKGGEIDLWEIPKAEWYAKTLLEDDNVQRGLLARTRFFNDAPIGTAGLAINMDKPGLDDVRVRRALQLLHPREQLIHELYYDQYEPLTSYWQGGLYANPTNEFFGFDPDEANRLLDEAGWTKFDNEGYRSKGGKRLKFTVTYRTPLIERSLTVYQERCRDAGLELELSLLTPAAAWKNLREKKYELSSVNWGALDVPNPETSWRSSLADELDNNNVSCFRDLGVDALCDEYDECYDVQRRVEIVREIDALIYPQHPYVLEHFNPAQRFVYWNKFGQPPMGTTRFADNEECLYNWWVDADKERELELARRDPRARMTPPAVENRWWQRWNALQNAR